MDNGVEKALEKYDTKSDYAINSNDSKSGKVSYPTIPMRILDSNSVTIDGIPLMTKNTIFLVYFQLKSWNHTYLALD